MQESTWCMIPRTRSPSAGKTTVTGFKQLQRLGAGRCRAINCKGAWGNFLGDVNSAILTGVAVQRRMQLSKFIKPFVQNLCTYCIQIKPQFKKFKLWPLPVMTFFISNPRILFLLICNFLPRAGLGFKGLCAASTVLWTYFKERDAILQVQS